MTLIVGNIMMVKLQALMLQQGCWLELAEIGNIPGTLIPDPDNAGVGKVA